MKGFFRKKDLRPKRFKQLREFIDRNFPKIPLKEINLEVVITYLDLSLEKNGRFGKECDVYLLEARRQLDRYVRIRLDYEQRHNRSSCKLLKKGFRSLGETDVVISLNYDLIADNTLKCIQREKKDQGRYYLPYDTIVNLIMEPVIPHVAVREEYLNFGVYLKLHGSIDWYHCGDSNCPKHKTIDFMTKEERILDQYCASCGSFLRPLIVPPTMNKAFEDYPRIGVMWTLAHHHLTTATRIVFFGVSFAPSDYYLRWLIKSSFLESDCKKKSIKVVDKCPSVKKKIEEMVDIEPIYYPDICTYISKEIESKQ